MDWGIADILIAAILIAVAFGVFKLLAGKKHDKRTIIISIIILIGFALIWSELAVGLFGSPIAGD